MIYLFGEFELDAARFELRFRGAPREVQPKVLRLILHLVRERARVVGNDELLKELWPNEVVGQGSIKRAILGARQALAENQSQIQTVRGFGYRFVGDLVEKDPSQAEPRPPASAPSEPVSATLPRVVAREELLGREAVLGMLLQRLQQTNAGTVGCVLITGEPGLGKTRTLEELLARAAAEGADVWFGRCTEVEGAPAFWPFIQVFREALRSRGPEKLRALLGLEAAEIAGAISELRDVFPDLPDTAPLSNPASRFRLFDSLAIFLRRAADERPILLALDDLHRADPASLRLLLFLLRQVQRARILFVGAFRPESPESAETAQLLEALCSESSARRVALHGFDARELTRYVALAIGVEPPASVVDLLLAQTAGNPLFVQHLIENWRAASDGQGTPAWQTLTSAPLSQGLAGAIERHLQLVSKPCRELLRVAAVLGKEFPAGLLSRVAERPVVECNTCLSEAVSVGMLRELPGELGRFRFAHVLVRDALYAQLGAAARESYHGRAARAIEAQGIGENPLLLAEVTRHFVAAPGFEPERALHYALRAADAALKTLGYEQAAVNFGRALDLLQYLPPDPRQRMTYLFRQGDALARVDVPAACAALYEAAAMARELGDTEVLVGAATRIANRPETGVVDAEQVALIRQALAALRAENPRDERCVLLQALIAKSLLYDPVRQERVSLARTSLSEVRELQSSAMRGEVLTRCFEAMPGPDELQDRVSISTELLALAHRTGDSLALLRGFAAQIEVSVEHGDMAAVDTALDGMELLAERTREPFHRWYAKVMRAMRAYVRGDIELCDRLCHEARRSGESLSPDLVRHIFCVQVNPVLRMRGQAVEAEAHVRDMMLRFPAIGGWSAAWGAVQWDIGNRDNARRCLDRLMVHGAAAIRTESSVTSSYVALAELITKVGDRAAAREVYDLLLPFADRHALTNMGASTYGPVSRHLATLAECLGDAPLAEAHYREALAAAERMPSPVFVSGTSWLYARLLFRAGDVSRRALAIELVSNAHGVAAQSELHSIAAVCRALAKSHGLTLDRSSAPSERRMARESEN